MASCSAPARPRCCGALQLHTGVEDSARELARETIAAYEGFDHVVVNVAGCGSAMKEYGYLFEGDERAEAFAARVRDVHELLADGEPRARRNPLPLKVAWLPFEVQPGQIVIVDVEGLDPNAPEGSRAADDKAKFTFRGEPKPSLVPDAPPVDMAKGE